MKQLLLLTLLLLSFSAHATLNKVYCELFGEGNLLRLEVPLENLDGATAALLNKDNELVSTTVSRYDNSVFTDYEAFGNMRLSISVEVDEGNYDVWFLIDGKKDEITHQQVSFTRRPS